jgi:hypothetical protein
MATFPPKSAKFPNSESSSAPLLFGNASVSAAGISVTPGLQYQSGAFYLPDPWPMTSFARFGAFDMNMTLLFDEQSGLRARSCGMGRGDE